MKFVYSHGTVIAAEDCVLIEVPDDIEDIDDIEEYCASADGVELDAIIAKAEGV